MLREGVRVESRRERSEWEYKCSGMECAHSVDLGTHLKRGIRMTREMTTVGCLFSVLFLILLGNGPAQATQGKHKAVLCYFEGRLVQREREDGRFSPENIDPSLCTHLVYNLALVGEGLTVVAKDKSVDLQEDGGLGLYNRTLQLKNLNPVLEVFIDVHDSRGMITKLGASGNRSALAVFSRNAADFVQSHGFNGMNFRPMESPGFEEVPAILREEFDRRHIKLMFLLPIDFAHNYRFEMTEIMSRNFDFLVIATYWKMPTEETEILSSISDLERVVEGCLARGIPAGKLVVAIPAFCMSMLLCDGAQTGVHSPVYCGSDEKLHDTPKRFLPSRELMRKMANASEDWVVVRDQESMVPYGYSKSLRWTSFEDPGSVRAKAEFILQRNLAGAAIMNVDMEDFSGAFGSVRFPLTRAAYVALNGQPV